MISWVLVTPPCHTHQGQVLHCSTPVGPTHLSPPELCNVITMSFSREFIVQALEQKPEIALVLPWQPQIATVQFYIQGVFDSLPGLQGGLGRMETTTPPPVFTTGVSTFRPHLPQLYMVHSGNLESFSLKRWTGLTHQSLVG